MDNAMHHVRHVDHGTRTSRPSTGENLGTTIQIAGWIIAQQLLQRLHPVTEAKWEESQNASKSDDIPTWSRCQNFCSSDTEH